MQERSCLFLIGAMGAGKSAVGKSLARMLGYEFADTDHFVESQSGVDISFIFEKEGESGFRIREQRALATLSAQENIVIATGGGCIKTQANRNIMRKRGLVVYLKASVDQLYERVRCSSHRPLINTENPKDVLAAIVGERTPIYERMADLTIDTEKRRVRAVAQDIHRQLEERKGESEQHDPS